jgi:hypothetical protein
MVTKVASFGTVLVCGREGSSDWAPLRSTNPPDFTAVASGIDHYERMKALQ